MSTKISKDDLKSPDQVTQTLRQGFVWTTTHSKIVITAIAAFIVIGVGASLFSYMTEKKEVAQQEKYFLLEKAYAEKKRGFDEAARAEMIQAQSKDKKATPAVDASKKATGDLDKDYGTIMKDFEAFIADAPKTKAAQMAALNLADLYMSYKKYDEAISTLTKVEPGLSKGDVLTALVLIQAGNAYANKGDCQGALSKWQTLTANKFLAFSHDEAKLRMGLCYETLNELAKAEELYTEIAKKEDLNTTDFAASKEAERYLRLLRAKKNL